MNRCHWELLLGLAKLLLGFDKRDVSTIKETLGELKNEASNTRNSLKELVEEFAGECKRDTSRLEKTLNIINNRVEELEESVKSLESALNTLTNLISEVLAKIEESEPKTENEQESDSEDLQSLRNQILELIDQGITTPTEIVEASGLPKHKVYSILRHLMEEGVVEKKREGRHVHYIIVKNDNVNSPAQDAEASISA
jgi:uncharacterized membrane protein